MNHKTQVKLVLAVLIVFLIFLVLVVKNVKAEEYNLEIKNITQTVENKSLNYSKIIFSNEFSLDSSNLNNFLIGLGALFAIIILIIIAFHIKKR